MIDRLSPAARNAALVVLSGLLAWFLWSVRSVLNPLILAYLLAFILHPLVLTLERRGWKRRSAVNLIFGGFALAITLLCFVVFLQGRGMYRDLTQEQGLIAIRAKQVEDPEIRQISDGKKLVAKWANILGLPFVFAAIGVVRWKARQRARANVKLV